jgi:prepilin-type N-terminal cleavage/methylation domain-containing protein
MPGAQMFADRRPTSPAPDRVTGFTLIEIVAVLVILGVLIAIAVPAYQSIRWEARKAAQDTIRAAMRANMMAARAAYLTQGLGPGSTVRVNGQSIEVYGEGVVLSGYPVPAGSPTEVGMFLMLGCGASAPAPSTTVPCDAFPGHDVHTNASVGLLGVWPRSSGTWSSTWCLAAYSAVYASSPADYASSYWDRDGIGTLGQYTRPSDSNAGRAAGAC